MKLGRGVTITNSTFSEYNYLANTSVVKDCTFEKLSYIGEGSRLRNVRVGPYCSIGPGVLIGLGEHPTDRFSTHPAFYSGSGQVGLSYVSKSTFREYGDTVVLDGDVWIGANVIVRAGVKIGFGAIVASGSVVTKDVEPYSIVGGVPAKFIRKRLDEKTVEKVVKSNWWLHDQDWIISNMDKVIDG